LNLYERQQESYRVAGGALRSAWPPEQAMDASALASFVDEMRSRVLATVTAGGRPQARPVAFMVFADAIRVRTGAGGRLSNVRRAPSVSVVISDRDGDRHRAVVADGAVLISELTPDGFLGLWAQRFGSRPEWATHWLKLRPDRLFPYAAPGSGA